MKITPLSFLARAEELLSRSLPAEGNWRFQRFINLGTESSSLDILLAAGDAKPRMIGTLHVRVVGEGPEAYLQGWLQAEGSAERASFTTKDTEGLDQRGVTTALEERWVAALTERMRRVEPGAPLVS